MIGAHPLSTATEGEKPHIPALDLELLSSREEAQNLLLLPLYLEWSQDPYK